MKKKTLYKPKCVGKYFKTRFFETKSHLSYSSVLSTCHKMVTLFEIEFFVSCSSLLFLTLCLKDYSNRQILLCVCNSTDLI